VLKYVITTVSTVTVIGVDTAGAQNGPVYRRPVTALWTVRGSVYKQPAQLIFPGTEVVKWDLSRHHPGMHYNSGTWHVLIDFTSG